MVSSCDSEKMAEESNSRVSIVWVSLFICYVIEVT